MAAFVVYDADKRVTSWLPLGYKLVNKGSVQKVNCLVHSRRELKADISDTNGY